MTTRTEAGAEKSFVSKRLPWIVAVTAAVVYLLTLNPWISQRNPEPYARAIGQTWYAETVRPVFSLVTSPFRWLPAGWAPVALNIFSVICAAAVLGLLARCVSLLPQDRTHKQRERESSPFGLLSLRSAWLPPVLAAIVCGLQLTFWENATSVSSEIFDLLLFAYSVRCLLEYRVNGSESWLFRSAVVYAAAVTESWIVMALAPAFLIAIVWMRGLGFFQLRFLSRLFLCGLAGLLFYFYLPLEHLRTDGFFLPALKQNIAAQFETIYFVGKYMPHHLQILLVLTSLIPTLMIAIRWKSHFGDSSPLGAALTTWIFHLTHAVLLGVCIWAAFDTGFSLRDAKGEFPFLDRNRDLMLPLYYLAALCVGYLSGYFLLVFKPVTQRTFRSESQPAGILNMLSMGLVGAVLVLTPIGLIYKNLPQIKITDGPCWQQYAAALTENLPPNAVLLSDRPDILLLAQAWLARSGKASSYIFLDTRLLRLPAYHRWQRSKHPDVWPAPAKELQGDTPFGDTDLTDLLLRLGQKNPLYYLHPSFGDFFETFYPVPHGLVYEMKPYPLNNELQAPTLPEAVFTENENFWKAHEPAFLELLPLINSPAPGAKPTFRQEWMQRMRIPFEKNDTAVRLGSIVSMALNTQGIQDQRLGRLDAAGRHFAEAQQFSPDNVVAAANLDFNQKLRGGERIVADSLQSFEDRFGKFRSWEPLLDANGLFDTATGCLAEGIVFANGHLARQAAQEFERVLSLVPNNQLAQLWLARSYVFSPTPEKAFPLIRELRAHAGSWNDAYITPTDVLRVEFEADYKDKKAQDIPLKIKEVSDTNLLDAAAQTCVNFGDYTNALLALEKKLGIIPDDVPSLVTAGFVHIRMSNFDQAIPLLTRAVSLQPTNPIARLNRAFAYLQSGKLDESQQDYETLRKAFPNAVPVNYGLAEIASRKKDTAAARHYYEVCLTNTPANSAQAKLLAEQINKLKSGSP